MTLHEHVLVAVVTIVIAASDCYMQGVLKNKHCISIAAHCPRHRDLDIWDSYSHSLAAQKPAGEASYAAVLHAASVSAEVDWCIQLQEEPTELIVEINLRYDAE